VAPPKAPEVCFGAVTPEFLSEPTAPKPNVHLRRLIPVLALRSKEATQSIHDASYLDGSGELSPWLHRKLIKVWLHKPPESGRFRIKATAAGMRRTEAMMTGRL